MELSRESATEAGEEPRTTLEMEMLGQSDRMYRGRQSEYHSRHEFLDVRLESYTDAVFAIVGTILIAYLNQTVLTRLEASSNSLQYQLANHAPFFTVYHFTFLHISVIWLNHSRVFSVIERVNDVVIWLNMLFLYVVSFVPLTFGILGEFNDTYEGIVIPSITIILINTTMAAIVWYVFRRKRFLPSDMSDIHAKYFKRAMYFKLLITPVLAGLAIGFGSVSLLAGQVLFYSSVFVVIIPKVVAYCIWWRHKTEITSQIMQVLSVAVSKERIEFFTDGVYAIISTLVILDITTVGIPSRDVVDEKFNGSLMKALGGNRLDYITYFTTFLVISLLWFVHHSLFNFIKKLNPLMFLAHQCSLSFVAVIPTTIELLAIYFKSATANGADKATAIQLAAISVAVVSLLQFLLLALMSFADDKCVDKTLFHSKSSLHLLAKVMIIPIACVIVYWCSMGSESVRQYSFYILYISTPLAFVLIYIIILKSGQLNAFFRQCWEKCSVCYKSCQHDKQASTT